MRNQRVELPVTQPTVAERDAVWALIGRCREALIVAGIFQWDALYPTPAMVEADLDARRLYALSEGMKIVAVGTLGVEPEAEYASVAWNTAEPAGIVHRLCVDPELQRRGYANRLMDVIERAAAEGGEASLRLDAYSENPAALALYRNRGYREAGRVWFPRRKAPFVCLERRL